MSYQSIKKLYRSGNIVAAKAALVEALKNNTLTAVEKKSVIRLNSEPLLEAYVAFMPPEPKKWEIMEIVHTGNVKIIDSLEVAEFPVAAQQELLKLNDVGIFRRTSNVTRKSNSATGWTFSSSVPAIANLPPLILPSTGWTERWRKCCWTATTFT